MSRIERTNEKYSRAEAKRSSADDDLSYEVEIGTLYKEIERLRAVLLNIQSLAERGSPIDAAKLATRCRAALANEQNGAGK